MLSLPPIVLASASPRRAALLREAGVSVQVRPVPCDETPQPGETALPYARRIAQAKLRAAIELLGHTEDLPILAADTVVWVEEQPTPLGKPSDPAACQQMLRAIAGPQGHRVSTAWALSTGRDHAEVHVETTRVWFRALTIAETQAYVRTDAWRDKAGGYGIQAQASGWVTRIEGSYTNVVGLPVAQVLVRLQECAR